MEQPLHIHKHNVKEIGDLEIFYVFATKKYKIDTYFRMSVQDPGAKACYSRCTSLCISVESESGKKWLSIAFDKK